MKPTLEEVKEYFKDAKEVRATNSSLVFKIDLELLDINERNFVNEYMDNVLLKTKGDFHCVYDGKKYAEIISKRKPKNTMKITKEFIRENQDKTIKEVFPDVCKVVQIGWYKDSVYEKWMGYFENDCLMYGFDTDGDYFKKATPNNDTEKSNDIKATDKEVEDALIKEAVKKGFYTENRLNWCFEVIDYFLSKPRRGNFYISNGILILGGGIVFKDGKWAEIIETKEPEKTKLRELIEVYEGRLKHKEFNLINYLNAYDHKSCIEVGAEIHEIKTFIENLKEL